MKHLIFLFLLSLSALSGFAQKSLPEDVAQSIQERIANGHSPSIVVGIIDKDGPQYYVFGIKTDGGEPVNEHTIYEIGSISKTFTGLLLADMVVRKQLKLDDPAQKHLPVSVTLPVQNDKQITLGHLSDHTSALPRLPGNMEPADPANPYADYTVEQLYAFLKSCTLTRDIGSAYEYSNLAQGLLGHILALKAGKSYEALVVERIALPLGMENTKITFDDRMKKNLAIGHSDGAPVANWNLPTLAGAGAIRSSLHDMLRFVAANAGLQKSKLYKAMKLSHQPRHDKVGGGTRVGLGWHISKGAEGDVVWHNGGTGGYRTFAGFVNATGKGVVVLTNSTKGADDIGFRLLNSAAKLIEVKKSGATALKKIAEAKGAQATWNTYQDLKNNQPKAYEFNEEELNTLGYEYLQSENTQIALVVFKISVAEHPNSSNVYDSYGEALMKDGQQAPAIENYKKSLELNPGNTNAVDMLAKMGVGKPSERLKVDEAILESYIGNYELAAGFFIVVTREGSQLFGQATGQGKFELFAKSPTEFYLTVVEARIVFNSKDGQVEDLTLFQGGQVIPGKRRR
ncbi:MAG: serine hydrolase [Saprospiraceae bacterium]|nr:serine hydrolase [Saprospiraceae bacterium]